MSEEAKEVVEVLSDNGWRLNNLYWVIDKDGKPVKFRMNWAQAELFERLWYRNAILKARQLGMSTFIALYILDQCLFNENRACGVVDKAIQDAKAKLKKIRFAWDRLGHSDGSEAGSLGSALGREIKGALKLRRESETFLEWSNGSSVEVGTSLRGGTKQVLHVSEFGWIAANAPKKAAEIQSGAFETVAKGQLVFEESTHEGGRVGAHYDLVKRAMENDDAKLTQVDFRAHFFPWWKEPEYRLDDPVAVSEKTRAYFERLKAEHGIEVSHGQMLWYDRKEAGLRERVRSEYPSTPEEAFMGQVRGSIYGEVLMRLRAQGRIHDFERDPGAPVDCFWDVGYSDFMAVWAVQFCGLSIRFLECWQGARVSIGELLLRMRELDERHGKVRTHFLPHDAFASMKTGETLAGRIMEGGFRNVAKVPRTPDIWLGINRLRDLLENAWFNRAGCEQEWELDGRRMPGGLQALEAYRTKIEETNNTIKETPVHDDSSHASDAARTFAEAYGAGLINVSGVSAHSIREKPRVLTGLRDFGFHRRARR